MQCQRGAVKIGTLANSLWRYAVLPSTLWQQLALLMFDVLSIHRATDGELSSILRKDEFSAYLRSKVLGHEMRPPPRPVVEELVEVGSAEVGPSGRRYDTSPVISDVRRYTSIGHPFAADE